MFDGRFAAFIEHVRSDAAFAEELAEILKGEDARSKLLVLLARSGLELSNAAVNVILGEGGPDSSEWNVGFAAPRAASINTSVIEGIMRQCSIDIEQLGGKTLSGARAARASKDVPDTPESGT